MTAPIYMRRPAAAEYIKNRYGFCSAATLNKLASVGGGPVFRKAGGRIAVYETADLDAWARAQLGPRQSIATELAPEAAE